MLNEVVLVDTGPILALYNGTDPDHQRCYELFGSLAFGKAYTCLPVLTEAMYMLRRSRNAQSDLFNAFRAGDLTLLSIAEDDLVVIKNTFSKYHDHQIDLADACLLHLADREGIDTIFTIDRRHFEMFRRSDGTTLKILPE